MTDSRSRLGSTRVGKKDEKTEQFRRELFYSLAWPSLYVCPTPRNNASLRNWKSPCCSNPARRHAGISWQAQQGHASRPARRARRGGWWEGRAQGRERPLAKGLDGGDELGGQAGEIDQRLMDHDRLTWWRAGGGASGSAFGGDELALDEEGGRIGSAIVPGAIAFDEHAGEREAEGKAGDKNNINFLETTVRVTDHPCIYGLFRIETSLRFWKLRQITSGARTPRRKSVAWRLGSTCRKAGRAGRPK